jgi:hypothetical protein
LPILYEWPTPSAKSSHWFNSKSHKCQRERLAALGASR